MRSFLGGFFLTKSSTAQAATAPAAVAPPPAAAVAATDLVARIAVASPSSSPTSTTVRPKNSFFKDVFGDAVLSHDSGSNRAITNSAFIAAFQPASIKDGEHHPARLNINGRNYIIGEFSTPTLTECRDALIAITSSDDFKKIPADKIKLKEGESVADGKDLIPLTPATNDAYLMHVTEAEAGLFQAASQFNALEFSNQYQIPENGISCYIGDNTQGPACALACGAGLAYRNDLVKVKDGLVDDQGEVGQTENNQINFLVNAQRLLREKAGTDITDKLDKTTTFGIDITEGDFFVVKNGYVESTANNLIQLNLLLEDQNFRNELKDAIRAGIHRNTEVTADPNSTDANPRLVNQIYVSALSIGYSTVSDKKLWEPMAKICLESAYEHTLIEGLRNNAERILAGEPPKKIMLTKVGGGVFGNQPKWIEEAMTKAIIEAGSYGIPFEVELVHFNKGDADNYYGLASDDVATKATKGSLEKAIEEANRIALVKIGERRVAEEAAPPPDLGGAGAATLAAPAGAGSLAAASAADSLAAAPPPAAATLVFAPPPAGEAAAGAGLAGADSPPPPDLGGAGAPHPAAAATALPPAPPPPPPSPPAPPPPPADPAGAAAGAGSLAAAAPHPAGGVWGPAAPAGAAAAAPVTAPVVLHPAPFSKPVVKKFDVKTGPGAEAKPPAGGAGAPPAIAPAPFIFPQALKRFSPIQKLLDSTKIADDQPLKPIVVILSGNPDQSGVLTLEKSLEVIKKHVDSRGENKDQKIIFIRNTGDHWNVHERSTTDDKIIDHQINGNGYCGLTSAIVASELINGSSALPEAGTSSGIFRNEGGSFNILTEEGNAVSIENKQALLTDCFGDVTSLPEKSPKKLAHDAVVRLIDNKGKKYINSTVAQGKEIQEELWLSDEQIIEVIKHRGSDKFVDINEISEHQESTHESLSRTPHFERKVAFLKYLNSQDIKISDINDLEGLTLSQLLFDSNDKSKYDPDRVKLCIKVLNKFIGENPSSDTTEKKQKILDFYKLMEDVSSNAEVWNVSMDNDFLAVKAKFDSLGIKYDEYQVLDKKITKNLATRPISEIDVAKKDFYKELKSDKSKEDLKEFQDLLKETFKKDEGTSFKDKINLLREKAFLQEFDIEFNIDSIDIFDNDYGKTYNKENLKPSFAFLARRDPDFIPAIIPEILQLKPKIAFKGWGKKIEFKNGKILIDDQEVSEIKNERGEDVIKELRKDFPQDSVQQDHPLFKHAVIDFFRNSDQVTLVYSDQTESKLEQVKKETLICNNPSKLFEKVAGNPGADEIDTKDLMLSRVKAHSEKTVGGVGGGKSKAGEGEPKAVREQPKPLTPKEEKLKEIKLHLDYRFKVLEEVLKKDDAILVIPGAYGNTQNQDQYFLANGLAVGQWDDTALLDQYKDYIKGKIDKLREVHGNKILLGNIGEVPTSKIKGSKVTEVYLPQFPVWDSSNFDYVDPAVDATILNNAKQSLIKNYEALCGRNKITCTIDASLDDNAKIAEYRKILFEGSGQFANKKIIHIWGANCENFNKKEGEGFSGGGQAEGFSESKQKIGGFPVITTILNYVQAKIKADDKVCEVLCKHFKIQPPKPGPSPGGAIAGGVPGAGVEVVAGAAALT